MRSMLKRQNAGEYNNGLPLMSSNPGAIGRSPYSATLSLSRSRLCTHFSPPAFVQSYRIRIKARARTPSRWGTIFRRVSGRHNSRNLGNLKRVAPLRLSRCCGAPSLDIAHLGATSQDVAHRTGACLDLNCGRATKTGHEDHVL